MIVNSIVRRWHELVKGSQKEVLAKRVANMLLAEVVERGGDISACKKIAKISRRPVRRV